MYWFLGGRVLVRISIIATKHYDQKARWGGKGLFSLHFHSTVDGQKEAGQKLKQGSNLEGGAGAEAMEECLLTGLLLTASSAYFL